jgi:hypothetical protein
MKNTIFLYTLVYTINSVLAANCGNCGYSFEPYDTPYTWDLRGGMCEWSQSNGPVYTTLTDWGQAETYTWGGWSDGYCWDGFQDIIQSCFANGCATGTWEEGNEWFWAESYQAPINPTYNAKRDLPPPIQHIQDSTTLLSRSNRMLAMD